MSKKPSKTLSIEKVKNLLKKAEKNEFGSESAIILELTKLVLFLWQVIDEKKLSIFRLRKILFGSKTEKVQQKEDTSNSKKTEEPQNSNQPNLDQSKPTKTLASKKRKGHGRFPSTHYTQAKIIPCKNDEISAGSYCPNEFCKGRLYDTKKPQPFIKLDGAAIVSATNYVRECLRCSFCQQRFTAKLPDGVKCQKYDISADVSLALHKYECALPFYRISQIQKAVGVPISSSTQYARIESLADKIFLSVKNPVIVEGHKLNYWEEKKSGGDKNGQDKNNARK